MKSSITSFAPPALHFYKWFVLLLCATLFGCASKQPLSRIEMQGPASRPDIATKPEAIPAPQYEPSVAIPPSSLPPPVQPAPIQPAPMDNATLLRTWVEQQGRLYQVAAPLLINNTELCPRHVRKLLGFTAKNRYSYSEQFITVAETELGLQERLQVMNVLPGSGAAQAGLQQGDVLYAVEIEPLPAGPDAERKGASLIGAEIQDRDHVKLTVLRQGDRITMDVPLTPACAMVIDLGNTEQINSYADGQRVMITRGMLQFTQSDEELAYVLAKEIAHNTIMPASRADLAALMDKLHVILPETMEAALDHPVSPYSADIDAESDRLSIYMLARAGYPLDHVVPFWKRLLNADSREGSHAYQKMHPASGEKLRVLAATIDTVRRKQQQGAALLPAQP